MLIFKCDACAGEVSEWEAVPLSVGRSSPLEAILGRAEGDRYSARFELCPECAASLILAFKETKARVQRGEEALKQ